MKLWNLALCATVASFGLASSALADNAPTVAFNVGVASDYMFRGLDQSAGQAAAFGGIDVTAGKFYVGTWISHVDFEGDNALFDEGNTNNTLAEVDLYGGFRPTLGPVSLDIGAIGYLYPKQPSGAHEQYIEYKVLGTVPVGPVTVGASVYYSPNNSFDTGHETYLEGNASYTFKNKASLSGAIGHEYLDQDRDGGLDGYTLWNVGVTYPVTDHLSADLRYYGTSNAAKDFFGEDKSHPFNAADRIVGTVKVTF